MNKAHNFKCFKCVVCNDEMGMTEGRKKRFYGFPRETNKCRAWIRAIGLESLVYMPLVELYEQLVCDAHFPQQRFSAGCSRLHILPIISQYPSLSDDIMALWPKSAMRVNPPQTRGLAVSDQSKEAEMNLLPNDEIIIDYSKPLMTCLEIITHNKRYPVKRPAGNSNTITVPLMTYSSSLEQGTIFAATEQKNVAKLPKLEFTKDNTKDFQDVVYVDAPIQHKSKEHGNVVTNKKVFYGLGTTISANKTVKTATKSNITTIKSHKNEESVIKITSFHNLLSNSQFDKSPTIHTYKSINTSINPKVSNSELIQVLNTSNLEQFMTTKKTTKPKEPDSITDIESKSNTDGLTYTELNIVQNTQTKDSTHVKPESYYTQVGDNDMKDYGLPLTQYIGTVRNDGDQRKRIPIAVINYTSPLLNCPEIVDIIDLT